MENETAAASASDRGDTATTEHVQSVRPEPSGAESMCTMTATYLSLTEVASVLNKSINVVKEWHQKGWLPDPDATFGGATTVRTQGWSEARLRRLMLDPDSDQSDWTLSAPAHYLSPAGVAELLHLSPNTVKWWVRVGRIPPFDAVTGTARGWTRVTVRRAFETDVHELARGSVGEAVCGA